VIFPYCFAYFLLVGIVRLQYNVWWWCVLDANVEIAGVRAM